MNNPSIILGGAFTIGRLSQDIGTFCRDFQSCRRRDDSPFPVTPHLSAQAYVKIVYYQHINNNPSAGTEMA
jgi:hypothetical protein